MAERLTTNQEVPGSTPGWIDYFFDISFCQLDKSFFLSRPIHYTRPGRAIPSANIYIVHDLIPGLKVFTATPVAF